ncbi:TRAPP subunit bet5 [Tulasnella sp. JGI-2019a]|nr:TRAPP subunit bet5 [Tulasnella sp. JGI-2019a]KAG9010354.1 TRAPP subunit bet5 [Tulasnella sp. JGI-2019a]KAG9038646.1 TRAPP subunit bet5 [Tulasnella sp. JGI-2019a]
MTIYSLYIYDRHCICVFYHDWQRVKKARPAYEGGILPNVASGLMTNPATTINTPGVSATFGESNVGAASSTVGAGGTTIAQANLSALPFDEEAKLVYGVLISLRNMVKKLSGRDETFVNYRTSSYKMHLYETISGYKFVMLTDPFSMSDAVRGALRQIYTGPFVEFVVRNPLVAMDSLESGIDNDHFRTATDRLVKGLPIYT